MDTLTEQAPPVIIFVQQKVTEQEQRLDEANRLRIAARELRARAEQHETQATAIEREAHLLLATYKEILAQAGAVPEVSPGAANQSEGQENGRAKRRVPSNPMRPGELSRIILSTVQQHPALLRPAILRKVKDMPGVTSSEKSISTTLNKLIDNGSIKVVGGAHYIPNAEAAEGGETPSTASELPLGG